VPFWQVALTIWPGVEFSRVSCVFFAPSFSYFSWEISFHHDLFVLRVSHHSVLGFKVSFCLVCLLLLVWILQKPYLVLEVTSWLLPSGILWVAQIVVSLSLYFNLGLEPKVPNCARFQYMKLAFNPRSIPLNPCVNDLSLTHNGLPFKLVLVVIIELRQQRTSLSLAMEDVLSGNQMGHDKSSLCESHLYVRDSATPSLSALVYMRC
jgi:hypothetical protein